jgi:hypothetical protein
LFRLVENVSGNPKNWASNIIRAFLRVIVCIVFFLEKHRQDSFLRPGMVLADTWVQLERCRGGSMLAGAMVRAIAPGWGGGPIRGIIPLDLWSTDRVLQRWAVSVGSGLATECWDDSPVSRPSPLSDDLAIIVDQCVLRAPRRKGMLVQLWYRTPAPTAVIARRLNCGPTALKLEWIATLMYMKLRFAAANSRGLMRLVVDRDAFRVAGQCVVDFFERPEEASPHSELVPCP